MVICTTVGGFFGKGWKLEILEWKLPIAPPSKIIKSYNNNIILLLLVG